MIAILQPHIPHYREEFFNGLLSARPGIVFTYEEPQKVSAANFNAAKVPSTYVKNIQAGPVLIYNPFALLKKEFRTLVLMLHFGHVTTWLLLLTKFIHRREIILWGHGISAKRYTKEEKKPSILLKWMVALSDGVWFYTQTEQAMWAKRFPRKRMTALNNTIADVNVVLALKETDKATLKRKHHITQETILLFCARFNADTRRPDLLLEVIAGVNTEKIGFVIIGDGPVKPDFREFSHVYDFGEVYDRQLKSELFQLADIYFQPAWVGLSIVEAMAYGKPVFTLERTEFLMQCVEYAYIRPGSNGMIFKSTLEMLTALSRISDGEIKKLSAGAKQYARTELNMENMISHAVKSLP